MANILLFKQLNYNKPMVPSKGVEPLFIARFTAACNQGFSCLNGLFWCLRDRNVSHWLTNAATVFFSPLCILVSPFMIAYYLAMFGMYGIAHKPRPDKPRDIDYGCSQLPEDELREKLQQQQREQDAHDKWRAGY